MKPDDSFWLSAKPRNSGRRIHSSVKEVNSKGGQGEPFPEDPEERPKDLGVQEDPCIHG